MQANLRLKLPEHVNEKTCQRQFNVTSVQKIRLLLPPVPPLLYLVPLQFSNYFFYDIMQCLSMSFIVIHTRCPFRHGSGLVCIACGKI